MNFLQFVQLAARGQAVPKVLSAYKHPAHLLTRVVFTHLTVLFSMPVYLWTLIRPERVPRNAVSTPSSMLPQKEWKQIKASGGNRVACIHALCADAHLDMLSMRAVQ